MRKPIVLALIFCIGLSILCWPGRVSACVCSPRGDNEREDAALAFADAAVVFEGEVASAKTEGNDVVIMFKMTKAYKGLDSDSIEVIESWAFSDCGFGLPPNGAKYFVYGFRGKDGKIGIGACRPLWGGADLRYARGEPPIEDDLMPFDEKLRLMDHPSLKTQGATLRGKVASLNPSEKGNVYVTVWHTDEKGSREDLTAARHKVHSDGSFQIRFLPAGTFFVTADEYYPITKRRAIGEYGKISLSEEQSLTISDIQLQLEPVGSITVHVIAPPSIHDRIFVLAGDTTMGSPGSKPYRYAQDSSLNEEGVARFTDVPFGIYYISVELTGETSDKPSWTHERARIVLKDDSAECTVTLKKANN